MNECIEKGTVRNRSRGSAFAPGCFSEGSVLGGLPVQPDTLPESFQYKHGHFPLLPEDWHVPASTRSRGVVPPGCAIHGAYRQGSRMIPTLALPLDRFSE